MPSENGPASGRTACPHCGKPTGLRWSYLLPSGNRSRVFTCASCGRKYDLSDNSKIAAIFGALLGGWPAIIVVGKIVRHFGGGAGGVILGTVAAAAAFISVTLSVSWLALRLVAKG
jgi:uncharacterized protein (DUF983 family)